MSFVFIFERKHFKRKYAENDKTKVYVAGGSRTWHIKEI